LGHITTFFSIAKIGRSRAKADRAKVGRQRGHGEHRSSRAEQARSFGTRTVVMMTRDLLPLVAASAASPDVVNGHDRARCETESPVGQNTVDFADAGSGARFSRHQIAVCVKSEFVRRFNAFGLSRRKAKRFYFRFSEICV